MAGLYATETDDIHELLTNGNIEVIGRLAGSSNATLLVRLECADGYGHAVYKPLRGERPLWDFPPGLYKREVAARVLSEALELHLVPPTIVRDGPFGEGSLQLFIDADPHEHYFSIFESRPDLHGRLRHFAFFDFIANNTDRKSGHILLDHEDHLWGIDHGVCFSSDFKLRTVIWDFADEDIPSQLLEAATPLLDKVPLGLAALLDDDEIDALQQRVRYLLENPQFPVDHSGRRHPWPLI
ncbi:MAG: hypothetical protein RLZ84_124 [Actinomycetota bacterium]|jgi:uncharacterized repeat protein (TIGR03843 family)